MALVVVDEETLPERMTPPIISYYFDMEIVGDCIAQSTTMLLAGESVSAKRMA